MTRAELRALCEAATAGPWEPATYLSLVLDAEGNPVANDLRLQDTAFIAAARNELPALLDELDAKDARLAYAAKEFDGLLRELDASSAEIAKLRERNEYMMSLVLRLQPHCPHALEHDSTQCPICGLRKLFDGIVAPWRKE